MKHIDEHILELYILRDEKTLLKKSSIEKHLRECAGCRELAEKMLIHYNDVEQELQNPLPPRNDVTSIVRIHETTPELWHKPNLSVPAKWSFVEQLTPVALQMFWLSVGRMISQRPVASTVGTIALLGFIVLIRNFNIDEPIKDDHPQYARYSLNSKLEVYNKENDLLWELPGSNLVALQQREVRCKYSTTEVVDLNGDGKNEILTIAALGQETKSYSLNALNSHGTIYKSFSITDKRIHFRQLDYNTAFTIDGFNVFRNSKNDLNIFILASNGRSPSVIMRLDSSFNVIGRYWHYGAITGMTIKMEPITHKILLIVTGVNDVQDMDTNGFPVLILLDPDKLNGEVESTATTGFGFGESICELNYVQFPKTDMETALNVRTTAFINDIINNSHFSIVVEGNRNEENTFSFEYIFSLNNINIQEVKFNAPTEMTHRKLFKENKINSKFDENYLEDLKRNVNYWDGIQWQPNPIKVHFWSHR